MTIRPFDWRDLPKLIKYRKRSLFLDKTLMLTRGPMLVPAGALLSYFAPATGIYTYLCSNNGNPGQPLIGQVIHEPGSSHGHLTFLAPREALESTELNPLLEHMIFTLGKRGAYHLLAEVEQDNPAFEVLRGASFAIYSRQRIWKLTGRPHGETIPTPWRDGSPKDAFSVRQLYNNLVPGLVQQVEPPPAGHLRGLVYKEDGELKGYVDVKSGPRGVWIQPFIHPDTEDVASLLVDLLEKLPYRRSRPVYLCVRSYQGWLEAILEELGAEPGSIQAVMVKHLAVSKRVVNSFQLKNLEGRQPEATAPFIRTER